jgi:hypothetical protein
MRVAIELELPGLEEVLADLMPAGVELHGLVLRVAGMRAELRAPMVGACVLTSQVKVEPGTMTLSRFDLEGAGFAKPLALGALRRKLAETDQQRGPWRIWGDSDGDRLQLCWQRG